MGKFLKSWGVLLAAIVIGVVTYFLADRYLLDREQSIRDSLLNSKSTTTVVVVATVDLAVGDPISSANMAQANMPAKHVSKNAVLPQDFSKFQGHVLKVPMSRGEPLLTHFLDGALIDRFSDLIKVGERAVTIDVDTISSNAQKLVIGDYVDVVLSANLPSPNGGEGRQRAFLPLFQRVKILAVDRHPLLSKEQDFRTQGVLVPDNEFLNYSTVTMSLDEEDANLLAFASGIGDIRFLLRNAEDLGDGDGEVLGTQSLFPSGQIQQESNIYTFLSNATSRAGNNVRNVLSVDDAVVNPALSRLALKSMPTAAIISNNFNESEQLIQSSEQTTEKKTKNEVQQTNIAQPKESN